MNIMGGNKDLVVKNVGGSPSNNQQNVVSDGVDPLVSNQMLQGNQAGFDIIMAHEDEETLVTIVDGPKRPRTNPPASGVSIIDSNDVSNYVSAGLAQQGPKKLLSWNVRGLGKSQTHHGFWRDLVKRRLSDFGNKALDLLFSVCDFLAMV
ncbi:hypothetical protein V6N12_045989 [Hibiscus sabdariffa]|uniref:Uncharacterized protein n=1 Tax=Hibiscus sabdariffa TaxID=183260 RepID=A0ABR2G4D3_9ROSI